MQAKRERSETFCQVIFWSIFQNKRTDSAVLQIICPPYSKDTQCIISLIRLDTYKKSSFKTCLMLSKFLIETETKIPSVETPGLRVFICWYFYMLSRTISEPL